MKLKLKDRLTKFLGEDAVSGLPTEPAIDPGVGAPPQKPVAPQQKSAQNFDNTVTSMSASITDLNKQTSDDDWKKFLAKMDTENQTEMVSMNDKIGDLARKLNALYADFTKSYWNVANKQDVKGDLKGKFMNRVANQPEVTDDATNKLPPQEDQK